MKCHAHPYVEDYIEIIAGYRGIDGQNNVNLFNIGAPIINLARYDIKIIPSLATQTIGGQGYTEKQASLALSLVIKYERQLAKKYVDISTVKASPAYRLPIRVLDRTTRLWVEHDQLKCKFPYESSLVEQVREVTRESKGTVSYDRDKRQHNIALTEWNLNWFYAFAKTNKFVIEPEVETLMQLLLQTEAQGYAMELQYANDQITITNAPASMVEYINEHVGEIAPVNFIRLLDFAPILGYTVNSHIAQTVVEEFGTRFWSLCSNRQLKVDQRTSPGLVKDLISYAQATQRFPIYVFEPDLSERLLTEFQAHFPNDIMRLDRHKSKSKFEPDKPVIYTSKIPKFPVGRIPLLISTAGILHGGDRQIWIQDAEKVVYFANEVYNNTVKGSQICKLD